MSHVNKTTIMKKTCFLFFLIFCIYSCCTAQSTLPEFAPYGAHWTHADYDESTYPATISLKKLIVLDHDTIVDGKLCRIFVTDNIIQFYAYRDSLKMWIHLNAAQQTWKLLYDFGWPVGQNVTIPVIGYNAGDTLNVTVQSISDTIISGYTLPTMQLHVQGSYNLMVVLNLGGINNYFLPQLHMVYIPEDAEIYAFRCYMDTNLGMVKQPWVVVCDTVTPKVRIPFLAKNNSLQLYPNPASDMIHIQIADNTAVFQADITLLDGRIIKRITQPKQGISLDGLLSGMYLVVMHLQNGSITTRKLVVQR
jgi:hypothetical protein